MISVNQIVFSPTNTTKNVTNRIVDGINPLNLFKTDITPTKNSYLFKESDITIIGVPVYSGRIPEIIINRLADLKSSKGLAVLVAIYGNRGFDDALLELKDLLEYKGFNVISAAAFIGEHSYSDSTYPIAINRPDQEDLNIAFKYGKDIRHLIENEDILKQNIEVPGNRPYKERKPSSILIPSTLKKTCSNCGDCIAVCPTDSIERNNPFITNINSCIRCGACVKICSSNSRLFDYENIVPIKDKLLTLCSKRNEPKIFI